ncbi:MAG: RsiV family protein [Candidatus Coprovivens sp.]
MKKINIIIKIGISTLVIIASFALGFLTAKNTQEIAQSKDKNIEEQEPAIEKSIIPEIITITYTEENYETENKNNVVITKNTRNIPDIKFSSNQPSADKIKKSLIAFSDSEWNNNIKLAAAGVAEEGIYDDLTEYDGLGASLIFENSKVTNHRITFYLSLEGCFGGVGWNGYNGYNYDITTGELLTLETISNNHSKLMATIKTEINKKLNELKEEIEIYDKSEEEINNLINKEGNWYFTDSGIEIIFQEYEISNGASGIITVTIDKNLINDYLKDEYKF